MKTIKQTFAVSLMALALMFTACNKEKQNNKTADKLEGDWQIESINKAQGPVDQSSMPQSVTLMTCDTKNDDCVGEWVSNKGDKNNFFWDVMEDGTIFTITIDPSQPSNQATSDLADYKGDYDILELTETKFEVKKDQITIEFGK